MQVARGRVRSFLEWIVAAGVLAAVAALGSVVVQEIRAVQPVTLVIAGDTLPDPPVPAGIPSRAVSVPVLLLRDGNAVRVGEGIDAVTLRLGEATGPETVEPVQNSDRLTRFYEYAGVRFVLVFEPFERHGMPRVAAIYLR